MFGESTCRCCLKKQGVYDLTKTYSSADGKKEIFSHMIRECFGIQLYLPFAIKSRAICRPCVHRLRKACEFRMEIIGAERNMLDVVQQLSSVNFAHRPVELVERNDTLKKDATRCAVAKSNFKMVTVKSELDSQKLANEFNVTLVKASNIGEVVNNNLKFTAVKAAPNIGTLAKNNNFPFVKAANVGNLPNNVKFAVVNAGTVNTKLANNNLNYTLVKAADIGGIANNNIKFTAAKAGFDNAMLSNFRVTAGPGSSSTSDPQQRLSTNTITLDGLTVTNKGSGHKHSFLKDILDRTASPNYIDSNWKALIEQDMTASNVAQNNRHKNTLNSSADEKRKSNRLLRIEEKTKFRLNILRILMHSTLVPFLSNTRHMIVKDDKHRHEYICLYCEQDFFDFNSLKTHYDDKHANLTEGEILTMLKTYHVQNRHQGFITAEMSNISCKICNKTLKTLDDLLEHLRSEHDVIFYDVDYKPIHGINGYLLSSGNAVCHYCAQEFIRFKDLNAHLVSHEEKYQCDKCARFFESKWKMTAHIKSAHEGFKCKYCNEAFDTRLKYTLHLSKDHNRRLRCPKCEATFEEPNSRRKHIVDVHLDKTVKLACYICKKVFNTSLAVRRHMRLIHLKEKCMCDLCGKSFNYKDSLKKHFQVMHTEARPYACKYCDKKFKVKQTLSIHIRGHLNDKRYACLECDATFIQIVSLRGHYKTHHPGVPVDLKKSYKPPKQQEISKDN